MEFTPTTTVREVCAFLDAHAGDAGGAECPCCGELDKRESRNFRWAYAAWLSCLVARYDAITPNTPVVTLKSGKSKGGKPAWVYDEHGTCWVHYEYVLDALGRIPGNALDYSKLRYWGLIEGKPANPDEHPDDAVKHPTKTGYWRPTSRGRDFVAGRIELPSHVVVRRSVVERFEGEMFTFDVALRRGGGFSYPDLMTPVEGNDPSVSI